MNSKYLIVKSAGDDFNFTTQRMPTGSDIGHPYEYAERLAKEVTLSMKARTIMLEALQDVLNITPNGLECNCGDPCTGTCTRAKVLAAIAAAKGEITL